MKAEAIIFDIDGTLWDSRALVAEGYNIQLRAEGLEHLCVTAEDLKPLFGKVMTDIADAILGSVEVPRRYEILERCMETENKHLAESPCDYAYPAIRETMEILKKKYRLFIVSNSQQGYPEVCMEKIGISDLIEGHLCFGDTGTSKGKTIRTLMERHGVSSAVYIGDTQGDYEATVEAGIPFIWATFGFGIPERYDAKVDSFAQLAELL